MIDGFPDEPELVPLIHAAWYDTEQGIPEWKKINMNMACSNCNHRAGKHKYKTYKYCPWCGAKMDILVARITPELEERFRTYVFAGRIVQTKN